MMCNPCLTAWGDIGVDCLEHHGPEVERLATALARSVGHETPTLENVGWFMDDAEAAIGVLGVQVEWNVVQTGRTAMISGEHMLLTEVNGTLFACAEGPMFLYDASLYEEDDDETL